MATEATTRTLASGSRDCEAVLRELAGALRRVKAGDLTVRLPRQLGAAGEVADAFNELVEVAQRQQRDLRRIGRLVGREGRLTERLDDEGYEGAWADGVQSVNALIDDLGSPAIEIARVIAAVAEGDLTEHMPDEINGRPLRGEFQRISRTVNTMVDRLSRFAEEVTRVAREVGTEGKLGGQANVHGVSGTWRDLPARGNTVAPTIDQPVVSAAQAAGALADGEPDENIGGPARGEVERIAQTINSLADPLRIFADEVTRVAREVGTEGKLGGQ